ncbi:hypothetical protein MSSIH_2692 [Methanosarcina siciliae HI350]|uniref:Uncharacterized protein n=1 Tax=Methanosarcina siciliae HI350 TaxID=1434119 RepID=A0A0E3PG18_9EURY|nr:hypothetical protein [Methanosarcina siciliae]AKB33382.1 hypothetical protein MSSIH_2692 [Methanosarcina siciliae HI350]
MAGESKAVRKKNTICATVSPYLKRKVDELVERGEFSSMSDLVSQSLAEFISRYESKRDEEKGQHDYTELLLKALLQTEEGKKLLASLTKTELQNNKNNSRKVVID